MTQVVFDDDELRALYDKAILEPNKDGAKEHLIKCPECGIEILMIPTLKLMNKAIENHVCDHKKQLKNAPIKLHQTSIYVRLALARQVLKYFCHGKF